MFRRAMLLTLLPVFALNVGCAGDKDGDKDDEDDAVDDTGGGEGDGTSDGGSNDGETPYIVEADAWCYLHDTGDTAYFWIAEAIAEDPQGTDTLESFYTEGVEVYAGDALIATYALVCDENGTCTASWNQDQDGVSCASADSYTISIAVMDEDANISDSAEVAGREGSSSSG